MQIVKLKAFDKFDNTTDALAAATSLGDSKLSKGEPPKLCLLARRCMLL